MPLVFESTDKVAYSHSVVAGVPPHLHPGSTSVCCCVDAPLHPRYFLTQSPRQQLKVSEAILLLREVKMNSFPIHEHSR